jgi:hypothetical protein
MCEEQRAYIDVLRHAVEVRIEDLGLVDQNIDTFTDIARASEELEISRRETARLSTIVQDQET